MPRECSACSYKVCMTGIQSRTLSLQVLCLSFVVKHCRFCDKAGSYSSGLEAGIYFHFFIFISLFSLRKGWFCSSYCVTQTLVAFSPDSHRQKQLKTLSITRTCCSRIKDQSSSRRDNLQPANGPSVPSVPWRVSVLSFWGQKEQGWECPLLHLRVTQVPTPEKRKSWRHMGKSC